MGQDPANRSESWKQTLHLAKILLRQYGTLHSFHVQQLECYPIACCKIAIDGQATVDGDKKSVTYQIQTKRKYYRKDGKVFARHKNSILGRLEVSNRRYEEDKIFAFNNLTSWSKELLWGPETLVEVYIDGSKVTGSVKS